MVMLEDTFNKRASIHSCLKSAASLVFLALMVSIGMFAVALAQQAESTNFQLDESFIGPGGSIDPSSSSYQLRGTLGDTGIGERDSASYNLLAGFTTDADPTLEFVVDSTNIDLGDLSTGITKTGTATFHVLNYNSNGYVVQTLSDPPTSQSSHSLANLTSPTASNAGVEQFGINLVANTVPASFGANPSQNPDTTFGYGYAETGYDTSNSFKYVKNDIIARSDRATGYTDFTISYIANISNLTPSGEYRMSHILVVTPTY